MGCLNRIFKMWADERFVQKEKNTGGKGCKVSKHPTGFIGSTDDVIFNTESGV